MHLPSIPVERVFAVVVHSYFCEVRTGCTGLRRASASCLVARKRVAFGDCDPAGIVYMPRFADYLVAASFWFRDVLTDGLPGLAVDMPIRGLELDFGAMIRTGDFFDMWCRVGAIRTSTYDLLVAGQRADGTAIFNGRLSPIAFDRERGAAVPIPAQFRARLEEYVARQDGD